MDEKLDEVIKYAEEHLNICPSNYAVKTILILLRALKDERIGDRKEVQ